MAEANTLAYYDTATITTVKGFILKALDQKKIFLLVIESLND